MEEYRTFAGTVGHDGPIAAALSLARARDALLDESSAKIGINETCVGNDQRNERRVRSALLALKAQPPRL